MLPQTTVYAEDSDQIRAQIRLNDLPQFHGLRTVGAKTGSAVTTILSIAGKLVWATEVVMVLPPASPNRPLRLKRTNLTFSLIFRLLLPLLLLLRLLQKPLFLLVRNVYLRFQVSFALLYYSIFLPVYVSDGSHAVFGSTLCATSWRLRYPRVADPALPTRERCHCRILFIYCRSPAWIAAIGSYYYNQLCFSSCDFSSAAHSDSLNCDRLIGGSVVHPKEELWEIDLCSLT